MLKKWQNEKKMMLMKLRQVLTRKRKCPKNVDDVGKRWIYRRLPKTKHEVMAINLIAKDVER